jgi:hypothetical protein
MTVHEPMTLATDLLLGAVALGLAMPLLSRRTLGRRARRWWGFALALTGLAAWSGGLWHGCGPDLDATVAAALWKVAVWAIGAAAAAMLAAAAIAALRPPAQNLLLVLVAINLALYVAWMSRHDDFRYVIYEYAPAMGLVLCLQLVAAARGRRAGTLPIAAGILVSFLAAAIQRSEAVYSAHFNANDLYHLVQTGAFVLVFLGARRVEDA